MRDIGRYRRRMQNYSKYRHFYFVFLVDFLQSIQYEMYVIVGK
jgi:hypothetical protein